MRFDDAFNFLKTGIVSADIITTVSPRYAEEIKTPQYGEQLYYLLRFKNIIGILNGIDNKEWNPRTDSYIKPNNYSAEDLSNKSKVKEILQEEFKLPQNNSIPVFGMVTRLALQKGVVELCAPGSGCLYNICKNFNLQFIIVGSGEEWCENELLKLSEDLKNLKVRIGYNDRLAHLVEAGSDFFLMPSKYEPSGLNQMYSMRYGTLPIVRNTGGLADTVENYDEIKKTGTGFVFNDLTPEAIYSTVGWALYTWYNRKEDIILMQQAAMKKDFSWDRSTEKYRALYIKLLESRDSFVNIKSEKDL
jgi:starch synthase